MNSEKSKAVPWKVRREESKAEVGSGEARMHLERNGLLVRVDGESDWPSADERVECDGQQTPSSVSKGGSPVPSMPERISHAQAYAMWRGVTGQVSKEKAIEGILECVRDRFADRTIDVPSAYQTHDEDDDTERERKRRERERYLRAHGVASSDEDAIAETIDLVNREFDEPEKLEWTKLTGGDSYLNYVCGMVRNKRRRIHRQHAKEKTFFDRMQDIEEGQGFRVGEVGDESGYKKRRFSSPSPVTTSGEDESSDASRRKIADATNNIQALLHDVHDKLATRIPQYFVAFVLALRLGMARKSLAYLKTVNRLELLSASKKLSKQVSYATSLPDGCGRLTLLKGPSLDVIWATVADWIDQNHRIPTGGELMEMVNGIAGRRVVASRNAWDKLIERSKNAASKALGQALYISTFTEWLPEKVMDESPENPSVDNKTEWQKVDDRSNDIE